MPSDEAFEGYWRRPDADARALRDGWYFTGDTGYVDAAGELFVTGRVDDMIITGGENISPGEIESVLSLHPAVAEVAVAGLPDARWGQRRHRLRQARWRGRGGRTRAWCRQSSLADYKRPRDYVFVAEIPKSPVGKILRRLLVAGEYRQGVTSMTDPVIPGGFDGFRVEIDAARERADIDARPAAAQRHHDAAARAVAQPCSRRSTPMTACVHRRGAGGGRAFFQRRRDRRVSRSLARARVAPSLEHRRAGALSQAGDRREPRLLLRGRFRTRARMRFPRGLGDLPVRIAGAAARPNPRLGRRGAAAEDGRHHPRQGHRHALAPHLRTAGS